MFRLPFPFLLFCAFGLSGQTGTQKRLVPLPQDQLEVNDGSESRTETYRSTGFMINRFRVPEDIAVRIPERASHSAKDISDIDVFDSKGELVYKFEFDRRGTQIGAVIKASGTYRWHNYKPHNGPEASVQAHYNAEQKLEKLDSIVKTARPYYNGDTVFIYYTRKQWTYLSGAVINERNQHYNRTFYKKRISIPSIDMYAPPGRRPNKKGYVYLKKILRSDYKSDSVYLDRFVQYDEGFYASLDNGKTEIHEKLPATHYIKERFDPKAKYSYGAEGASFVEPTWTVENAWCPTAIGRHMSGELDKSPPQYYKCTLSKKKLIDSIFFCRHLLLPDSLQDKENQTFLKYTETPSVALVYTVKYKHFLGSYYSNIENEIEPQLIVADQLNRFGNMYYVSNFGKYFNVPQDHEIYPGDVNAFVKNKVKKIHVAWGNGDLHYTFELDSMGNLIGGYNGRTNKRDWKNYSDKQGNKYFVNKYYDHAGWLTHKDSTAKIKMSYKLADTTVTYFRHKHYNYKKGSQISERNREYNEKYLNKRIKTRDDFPSYSALIQNDPDGKRLGYIYLKKALKTDFEGDKLYLCFESVGDYEYTITKDTSNITDKIPHNHRIWTKLRKLEETKYIVSGENFHPPYDPWYPICGGSGYNYKQESNDEASFRKYKWTLNSKGLYDACYQTDPVYKRQVSRNDEEEYLEPTNQEPKTWLRYVISYEYY